MSSTVIGLWAVNGEGRVALVREEINRHGMPIFIGKALDGGQWSTSCPHVLGRFEQSYFKGTGSIERVG